MLILLLATHLRQREMHHHTKFSRPCLSFILFFLPLYLSPNALESHDRRILLVFFSFCFVLFSFSLKTKRQLGSLFIKYIRIYIFIYIFIYVINYMHICVSLCRTRIAKTKLMLQVTSAAAHRKARTHGRFCGTSYFFFVVSSSLVVFLFLFHFSSPFVSLQK